jgi:hypothetical protein
VDIYQILIHLLEKPNAPKFYRELRDHYVAQGMIHESEAINQLLQQKFEKQDAQTGNPDSDS